MYRGTLTNQRVRSTSTAYEASLTASHPWDVRWVTLALGLGAGVLLNRQEFETQGSAPSRTSTEPFAFVLASVTHELTTRMFLRLEARALCHFARVQERATSAPNLDVAIRGRGTLLLGAFPDAH
ncbi:MAG: hypothetical protein RLZZ450_141 [Pseudomonadota bacterium]